MNGKPYYRAKNIKIRQYHRDSSIRDYMIKFYAARYLWSRGYRCIGFDVEILPYGKFSVVGTKKNSKEIAIVDCINSIEEYVLKTHIPTSLKEKKEELSNKILAQTKDLIKMEKMLDVKVDITQDKNWCNLANSLREVYHDVKHGGLYWHMLHSYPVATEHWVFCFSSIFSRIDQSRIKDWGLVVLKNGLFEMRGKTIRKSLPKKIKLENASEDYINKIESKIARSLTMDVIGAKELNASHFEELFKLVIKISDDADKKIAESLLEERKSKRKG